MVSTISECNASIAMSKLVGKGYDMRETSIKIGTKNELSKVVEDLTRTILETTERVVIICRGWALLMLRDDAYRIVDMVEKKEIGTTKSLDSFSESVLEETSNILGNAYLNILCDMLDTKIPMTPPKLISISPKYTSNTLIGELVGNKDINHFLMLKSKVSISPEIKEIYIAILLPVSQINIVLNAIHTMGVVK